MLAVQTLTPEASRSIWLSATLSAVLPERITVCTTYDILAADPVLQIF